MNAGSEMKSCAPQRKNNRCHSGAVRSFIALRAPK
jgi:hypothetical protein